MSLFFLVHLGPRRQKQIIGIDRDQLERISTRYNQVFLAVCGFQSHSVSGEWTRLPTSLLLTLEVLRFEVCKSASLKVLDPLCQPQENNNAAML